jgi:hypothetical protein
MLQRGNAQDGQEDRRPIGGRIGCGIVTVVRDRKMSAAGSSMHPSGLPAGISRGAIRRSCAGLAGSSPLNAGRRLPHPGRYANLDDSRQRAHHPIPADYQQGYEGSRDGVDDHSLTIFRIGFLAISRHC